MARGEFRKDLEQATVDIDEMDYKNNYIDLNEAIAVIDDIENLVNEIRDKLEPFTVLYEIKEIYELADKLSDKLY